MNLLERGVDYFVMAPSSARKVKRLIGPVDPEISVEFDPTPYDYFVGWFRLVQAARIDMRRYEPEWKEKFIHAEGWAAKAGVIFDSLSQYALHEKAARSENKMRRGEIHPANVIFNRANEHEGIQDHAWKHSRMFGKCVGWLMRHMPHNFSVGIGSFRLKDDLSHKNRYMTMRAALPYALVRAGGTHDRYQTYAQYFMALAKESKVALPIRPKDNHEIYGAILVMLDSANFCVARRISQAKGRVVDAMLAYGILGHGSPKTYFTEIYNTEKAYVIVGGAPQEIEDADLFALVDTQTLDWSSISPSQLVRIGRYIAKRDNLQVFDTETGLPPEVEEAFRQSGDLARVLDDHAPLFFELTDQERELLRFERQDIAFADFVEMLVPPVAAGERKVNTPKAKDRDPVFAENPMDTFFDPEAYVKQLQEIDGHTCKSDLERQLFELFEFIHIVQDSGLLENSEIKPALQDVFADIVAGTFWYFGHFVRNNIGEIHKLVNESFSVQALKAAIKIYEKAGAPDGAHIIDELREQRDRYIRLPIMTMKQRLLGYMHMDENFTDRLHTVLDALQERSRGYLKKVMHKCELKNKKPMTEEAYEQLFAAIVSQVSALLGMEQRAFYERYVRWNSRSVADNIVASSAPWAKSELSVGAFHEAKEL